MPAESAFPPSVLAITGIGGAELVPVITMSLTRVDGIRAHAAPLILRQGHRLKMVSPHATPIATERIQGHALCNRPPARLVGDARGRGKLARADTERTIPICPD